MLKAEVSQLKSSLIIFIENYFCKIVTYLQFPAQKLIFKCIKFYQNLYALTNITLLTYD